MKGLKRLLYVFLGAMIVFFLFLLWYQNRYSMDIVTPYAINETYLQRKLFIAAQSSDFKNKVTSGIVKHFKLDSIYIQVFDIKELGGVDPKDFDALVIIHTWEYGEPPDTVKAFLDKTITKKDKIIILTTSGEGSYKMEDVDAIAGESKLENAPVFVEQIIRRLTILLTVN